MDSKRWLGVRSIYFLRKHFVEIIIDKTVVIVGSQTLSFLLPEFVLGLEPLFASVILKNPRSVYFCFSLQITLLKVS